jgi:hypothetical protein
MARSYAPILTSIWQDRDVWALSGESQRVYFLLISQPDTSYCGVVGVHEKRWAKWSADASQEAIGEAIGELQARGFVTYDEETEELFIRSFMKHNNVFSQPNITKVALRQFDEIHSPTIKLAVWEQFPEDIQTRCSRPSGNPSPYPSGNPTSDLPSSPTERHRPDPGLGFSNALLESEPEPEPSSSTLDPSDPNAEPFDDEEDSRNVIAAAFELVAEQRLARRESSKGPVGHRAAWLRSALAGVEREFRDRADLLMQDYPTLQPSALAELLEPLIAKSPTQRDPLEQSAMAQAARLAEAREREIADRQVDAEWTQTDTGRNAAAQAKAMLRGGS